MEALLRRRQAACCLSGIHIHVIQFDDVGGRLAMLELLRSYGVPFKCDHLSYSQHCAGAADV